MNVLKKMNSLTVKDKDNLEESIDDEEEIEDKYEDEYDALSDDLDNLDNMKWPPSCQNVDLNS